MKHWIYDSIFYHIYTLGFCGAPLENNFISPPVNRINKLNDWIEHIVNMNINAIYLGPLFESTSHGYDTKDFFMVDRRLGTNDSLKEIISVFHRNGIRVILDGVFNHVGRNFFAFENLKERLYESEYRDWFINVDFNKKSPHNDPFSYSGWNNHYNLVKLNLKNKSVTDYLFQAVRMWIREFNIDGLRLDAADCIDMEFLKELSGYCRMLDAEFWLMGEIIHGDYNKWANDSMLDSTTNYECYKGLYSSHNDKNYFEIAYSLNRQFGENGIYKNLALYNFVDNHDVDRIATVLKNNAHLYPLYCLLFTMPGVPSIYYGSEWGIQGKKGKNNDNDLRPAIELNTLPGIPENIDLLNVIKKYASIRKNSSALKKGNYRELYKSHKQLVFMREYETEKIIVAVNSEKNKSTIEFNLPLKYNNLKLYDLLNEGVTHRINNGRLRIDIWPNWAGIYNII